MGGWVGGWMEEEKQAILIELFLMDAARVGGWVGGWVGWGLPLPLVGGPSGCRAGKDGLLGLLLWVGGWVGGLDDWIGRWMIYISGWVGGWVGRTGVEALVAFELVGHAVHFLGEELEVFGEERVGGEVQGGEVGVHGVLGALCGWVGGWVGGWVDDWVSACMNE